MVRVGEPVDEVFHERADVEYVHRRREDDAVRLQQHLLYRCAIVLKRAFVLAFCHASVAAGTRLEVRVLQEEVLELHVAHRFHLLFDHFYDLIARALSLGAAHYRYYFHASASLWSRKLPGGNIPFCICLFHINQFEIISYCFPSYFFVSQFIIYV